MDTIIQGLVALACAAITGAVPILLPRLLTLISANVHSRDVALIAEAAARAAGRIIVSVAGQAPGSGVEAAVNAALAAEVAALRRMLPETIAKVGASDATLTQMVQGEVGRLLAGPGSPVAAIPSALGVTVAGLGR